MTNHLCSPPQNDRVAQNMLKTTDESINTALVHMLLDNSIELLKQNTGTKVRGINWGEGCMWGGGGGWGGGGRGGGEGGWGEGGGGRGGGGRGGELAHIGLVSVDLVVSLNINSPQRNSQPRSPHDFGTSPPPVSHNIT